MTRQRWTFAAAAFGLGLAYTSLLAALGAEIRIGGRDVALPIAVATEIAFGMFGFFLGKAAEARVSDGKLAALQSRLFHAEKLSAVGQLASRIAHEVRNPLAIIRTMVQNLEETPSPSAGDVRKTCQPILDEIDRLNRVTTSLVGLSRPPTPRLSEVEAPELLARVEWLARRLLEGKTVTLAVNSPIDADSPKVQADPDLACQVLLGLVSNAADVAGDEDTIELGWHEGPDAVIFHVKDRGPGVADDIRDKIFEPFYTTRSEGTGLGLAIARELAEAQGGSLVLEQNEESVGRGSHFALYLPRA